MPSCPADDRAAAPPWSAPDSLGHAVWRRLARPGIAAPGLARMAAAADPGALHARHQSFLDTLTVRPDTADATPTVVARRGDDAMVFRHDAAHGAAFTHDGGFASGGTSGAATAAPPVIVVARRVTAVRDVAPVGAGGIAASAGQAPGTATFAAPAPADTAVPAAAPLQETKAGGSPAARLSPQAGAGASDTAPALTLPPSPSPVAVARAADAERPAPDVARRADAASSPEGAGAASPAASATPPASSQAPPSPPVSTTSSAVASSTPAAAGDRPASVPARAADRRITPEAAGAPAAAAAPPAGHPPVVARAAAPGGERPAGVAGVPWTVVHRTRTGPAPGDAVADRRTAAPMPPEAASGLLPAAGTGGPNGTGGAVPSLPPTDGLAMQAVTPSRLDRQMAGAGAPGRGPGTAGPPAFPGGSAGPSEPPTGGSGPAPASGIDAAPASSSAAPADSATPLCLDRAIGPAIGHSSADAAPGAAGSATAGPAPAAPPGDTSGRSPSSALAARVVTAHGAPPSPAVAMPLSPAATVQRRAAPAPDAGDAAQPVVPRQGTGQVLDAPRASAETGPGGSHRSAIDAPGPRVAAGIVAAADAGAGAGASAGVDVGTGAVSDALAGRDAAAGTGAGSAVPARAAASSPPPARIDRSMVSPLPPARTDPPEAVPPASTSTSTPAPMSMPTPTPTPTRTLTSAPTPSVPSAALRAAVPASDGLVLSRSVVSPASAPAGMSRGGGKDSIGAPVGPDPRQGAGAGRATPATVARATDTAAGGMMPSVAAGGAGPDAGVPAVGSAGGGGESGSHARPGGDHALIARAEGGAPAGGSAFVPSAAAGAVASTAAPPGGAPSSSATPALSEAVATPTSAARTVQRRAANATDLPLARRRQGPEAPLDADPAASAFLPDPSALAPSQRVAVASGEDAVQRRTDGAGVQESVGFDPQASLSSSGATMPMPVPSGPPVAAGTGLTAGPPPREEPASYAAAGLASAVRAGPSSSEGRVVVRAASRPGKSAASVSGPPHRSSPAFPGAADVRTNDAAAGTGAGGDLLPVVAAASSSAAPPRDGTSRVLVLARAEGGAGPPLPPGPGVDADAASAAFPLAAGRDAGFSPTLPDSGGPAASASASAPLLPAGPSSPHVLRRNAPAGDGGGPSSSASFPLMRALATVPAGSNRILAHGARSRAGAGAEGGAGGAPAGNPTPPATMPLARQRLEGGADTPLIGRAPSPGAEPQPPYELPGPPAMPQLAPSGPGAVRPGASGDGGASGSDAAGGVDVDEIVERAWRAVLQRLAIEQERRGFRRWN